MKPNLTTLSALLVLTTLTTVAHTQSLPPADEIPLCSDPVSTYSCLKDSPDPIDQDQPPPQDTDPEQDPTDSDNDNDSSEHYPEA